MRVSTLFAVCALLVLGGCGGSERPGAASGPGTEPGAVSVVMVDPISGRSVQGIAPSSGVPGTPGDFSATGYLPRHTLIPADGRVTLWPVTVNEAYVREIVYDTWSFMALSRLFRWDKRTLTVTPGIVPAEVFGEIASTGTVTFVEGPIPDVEVAVDPDHPDLTGSLVGFTRCTTMGFVIDHCRVVLKTADVVRSPIMLHEMGHTVGLGHSTRAQDVMHPRPNATRLTTDERVLLSMMYLHRRPGNAPPDDDVALGAMATRRWTLMIRD